MHDTMATAPANTAADAQTATVNDVEKHAATHDERMSVDDKRAVLGDYSGAVAKTDPAEIKLVRKLDWWIMVGLCTSGPLGLWGLAHPAFRLKTFIVD